MNSPPGWRPRWRAIRDGVVRLQRGQASRDLEDVVLFALVALLVPLVWVVAFGWRPPALVGDYDGMQIDLPVVRELLLAAGNREQFLYRVDWMGGASFWGVTGIPWPWWVAARLGLSETATLNLTMLGVQCAFGWAAAGLAVELARLWGGAYTPPSARLTIALLAAFAPVNGVRLSHSHWGMLLAGAALLASLRLVAGALGGGVSIVAMAGAAALVSFALGAAIPQPVFNAALVGVPVLVAIVWRRQGTGRAIGLSAMAVAAGVLLALPSFVAMLQHATGGEAARSLGREVVTYSFDPITARDWWTSLFWNAGVVDGGRDPGLAHETSYPAGPLLLLLLLVPAAGAPLAAVLAASAALAVLFSLNVQPVSDFLLALVPPLRSFRVPARTVLPALALLPVVASAAVLVRADAGFGRAARWSPVAALGAALLLAGAPPWLAEAALAGATVAAVALLARGKPSPRSGLVAALVLGVLAGGSVAAFGRRLLFFPDAPRIVHEHQQFGAQARAMQPALASPFVRVAMHGPETRIATNSANVAGLSQAAGYWIPPRRFLALALAAGGRPWASTEHNVTHALVLKGFDVLHNLYNIRFFLSLDEGRLKVVEALPGPGPAWFSQRISERADVSELVADLRRVARDPRRVADELRLLRGDPAVPADALRRQPAAECSDAQVLGAESPDRQSMRVRVDSPAECPLTVSANLLDHLHAEWVGEDGRSRPLQLFPGYGALTSTWVPAGRGEVRIAPRVSAPPAVDLAPLAGAGLLLAALVLARGRRAAQGPLPES